MVNHQLKVRNNKSNGSSFVEETDIEDFGASDSDGFSRVNNKESTHSKITLQN